MSFNDPYFAVKAATANTIEELSRLRNNTLFPLVQALITKQAAAAMSLSVAAEEERAGGSVSGSPSQLVMNCTEVQKHLPEFESELAKVKKSLQFIDNMLNAIKGGNTMNFTPAEVLTRQTFYDNCSREANRLSNFLEMTITICREMSEGDVPSRYYNEGCGINSGSPTAAGVGGGSDGGLVPPPSLNGGASGAIVLQNIKKAALERKEAHERNRRWAEEMHVNDNEAFMQAQRELQQDEVRVQNAALDRIHFHVGEMKSNVVNIRDELNTQQVMLEDQLTRTDQVKMKVAAATAQVNHLLENMSDCGKYVTIITLTIILVLLIVISM